MASVDTTVPPDDLTPRSVAPRAESGSFDRAIWPVPLVILIADQLTKWLVMTNMAIGDTIAVFGNWLRLTYVVNPGGAFGLRWAHIAVYYLAAVAVSLWIIYQLWRFGRTRQLSIWGLALILGGAIGNFIDRVRFGEVTDFVDVEFFNIRIPAFDFGIIHHPGYVMDRWPTFNVADSAVTVGIVILLLSLWYNPFLFARRSAAAAVDLAQDDSEHGDRTTTEQV